MPKYSNILQNFQDFMVTLDRKDWEKQIKVKQEQNYYSNDSPKSGRLTIGAEIQPAHFRDPMNMQQFITSKADKFKSTNEEKLLNLKK